MHVSHVAWSLMQIAACFCDPNRLNRKNPRISSGGVSEMDQEQPPKFLQPTAIPRGATCYHHPLKRVAGSRWVMLGRAEAGPNAPQPYGDDGRDGQLGETLRRVVKPDPNVGGFGCLGYPSIRGTSPCGKNLVAKMSFGGMGFAVLNHAQVRWFLD